MKQQLVLRPSEYSSVSSFDQSIAAMMYRRLQHSTKGLNSNAMVSSNSDDPYTVTTQFLSALGLIGGDGARS
jgi:hypothetical protein